MKEMMLMVLWVDFGNGASSKQAGEKATHL